MYKAKLSFHHTNLIKPLVVLFCIAIALTAKAQPLQLEWAKGLFSTKTSFSSFQIQDLLTDKNGSLFVAASFQGSVDIDPGNGEEIVTSGKEGFLAGASFIAKYDHNGKFLFGFSLEARVSKLLSIDNESFVATGTLDSIADFDPSTSVHELDGQKDELFAVKYSNSGTFINGFSVGSKNAMFLSSSALDSKGNLYFYGDLTDTVDFDPSVSGEFIINSAQGNIDSYIAKYSPTGAFVFAFTINASANHGDNEIMIDNMNNIFISGRFAASQKGTLDLDPGPNNTNWAKIAGIDDFWAKYSSDGTYLNSHLYDGSINKMTTDNKGNIYLTGSAIDGMDVDISNGQHLLSSNPGGFDQFIIKYNSNFDLIFGKTIDGNSKEMQIENMQVDGNENIYLCGNFKDTIGFVKGSVQGELLNKGSRDAFIAAFNNTGQFKFAHSFGGAAFEEATSISLDHNGNIWLAGELTDSINLDPQKNGSPLIQKADGRAVYFGKYLDPSAVGLDEIENGLISIYTEQENLVVHLEKLKNAQIQIIGINGKVFHQIKNTNSSKTNIPLESLPKNQVFIVQVESQGSSLSKKIYIQ